MFVLLTRRRLALRLRRIHAGGSADPLQYSHGAIPLLLSYSSIAAAAGTNSEPCPATVSYLVSCGLSPAAAKADAVRALFRRYGFSDADVTRVVRGSRQLLNFDADRTIRPKLDFFVSLGLEPRKLASAPIVLGLSLDKHIVPCIQFLRGIIGSNKAVCHGLSRVPCVLKVNLERKMFPAVEALHLHGLTRDIISRLLVIQMGVLLMSPARISEIFQDLKTLGLYSTDAGFLYCFKAMCCISRESRLQKLAVYRSFGLSDSEVLEAFKRYPTMLLLADETLKRKLQFFIGKLKLESSDLMKRPVLLGYSLEKIILPRCAVLNVLMREGKIERNIKLPSVLICMPNKFYANYVLRYANDVPDVVKAYEGKIKFEGFRD